MSEQTKGATQTSAKPNGKQQRYSAEQVDDIAQFALPIFQELVQGELRGYEQDHIARIAFARARAFVRVKDEIKKAGVIDDIEKPATGGTITLPNMEKRKHNLEDEQRYIFDYVNAGEPGPEWLEENRSKYFRDDDAA